MTDKLYKIGQWLMRHKEKLVLVCLLAVLCYQVYQVVAKEEQEAKDPPQPPRAQLREEDWEGIKPPPVAPARRAPIRITGLTTRNPFTIQSIEQDSRRGRGSDATETGLRLIGFAGDEANPRAQIIAGANRARWYREGESFENYQVTDIDPVAQTVSVFSTELGRTVTLRPE
jgi:hypothetical protein